MERENVDRRIVDRLSEALAERKEILEAYLFGSHARGEARPDSDIDVAVYIDEALADDGHWGYRAELTTDLMVALGVNEVDVVVLNKAPILLYHRVLRDGVRVAVTRSPRDHDPSRTGALVLLRLPSAARQNGRRATVRRRRGPVVTPGRPDPHVVDRHLIALRTALGVLRQHADVTPGTLGADPSQRWAVERGLQLCAQNALDIAGHISSAIGLDPDSYGSAIGCLVEADVLPKSFGERFRGIAGFRNVLVHGYLDIDLDLIVTILAERLDDFEEFAGHVEHWLAAQRTP